MFFNVLSHFDNDAISRPEKRPKIRTNGHNQPFRPEKTAKSRTNDPKLHFRLGKTAFLRTTWEN